MTVGDLKKILSSNSISDDFEIEFCLEQRLSKDQLDKMVYPYPYVFQDLIFSSINRSVSEKFVSVHFIDELGCWK
jgi:hypothetical protein